LGKQQQDTFNVKTEIEKLNLTTKAHIRQSEEMYYTNTKKLKPPFTASGLQKEHVNSQ